MGAIAPLTLQSSERRRFWALVRRQHGVISRGQLIDFGLSVDAIRHRLASGRLHRVHRGVYAVGRRGLPRFGELMAAVLACGDGAALSHESAATDRVDATVNSMEPPARQAMTDGIDGETEIDQLSAGDHAVLAPNQGPEPPSFRGLKGQGGYSPHKASTL